MKKIKLLTLTPLLPAAIVPAIATSCNKIEGQVNQNEMLNGILKLTDCNIWNYGGTANVTKYSENESKQTQNWDFKFTNTGANINILNFDTKVTDTYYLKKIENKWSSIVHNYSTDKYSFHRQLGNNPTILPVLEYWSFINKLKDKISEFKFDSEYKGYVFDGKLQENNFYSFIRFDSNKNISFIYLYYPDSETQYNSVELRFNNYGAATATYPFKDTDINYPANTILNYSTEHKYYWSNSSITHSCTFIAHNIQLEPTKIAIYQSDETEITNPIIDINIYVNDVKSNCTLTKAQDKSVVTVSGLKLNVGDRVQIVWNWDKPVSAVNTYILRVM